MHTYIRTYIHTYVDRRVIEGLLYKECGICLVLTDPSMLIHITAHMRLSSED